MKYKIQDKAMLPGAIIIAGIMVAIAVVYTSPARQVQKNTVSAIKKQEVQQDTAALALEQAVIPSSGIPLPVVWGITGQNLIRSGVVDAAAFKQLYASRGMFTDEDQRLLFGTTTEKIIITRDNAGVLLNLFWALGLGQKSPILENGEMKDPRYGGAGNFASTGGWTLAQGKAMDHYSYHTFFELSKDQWALVDKVSQGIFRPCCGNSVHFPDCNHGMAMLGLLELMASQGASEQDMWKAALAANSYWFPDAYMTIATYVKDKGIEWKNANPQAMLSADYSSAEGYAKISSHVIQAQPRQSSGGCGVDAGQSQPVEIPKQQQQSGCSV